MNGMTKEETRGWITWAMNQFELVCNLRVQWSPSPKYGDIIIEGMNDNSHGGLAWEDLIKISTVRKMTGRGGHSAGGIILHEFCHTYAKYNLPHLKHTPLEDPYRDWLMHPWGTKTDWFSPEEVKILQAKAGAPEKRFRPHPLTYVGKKQQALTAQIEGLRAARKKSKNKAERAEFTQDIYKLRMERRKGSNEWHARRDRWQGTPFAIVPKVETRPQLIATVQPFSIKEQGEPICGCQ